jgi:DNA-binding MarR family transcriptional regulator
VQERVDSGQVADALRVSVGTLVRRVRQIKTESSADDVTLPETTALVRLDRGGPATSSALAKQEQISPQSMGATLASLEARGLVERRPDPDDGRRILLTVTPAGRNILGERRSARSQHFAKALSRDFTQEEIQLLGQAAVLLERLAQSL